VNAPLNVNLSTRADRRAGVAASRGKVAVASLQAASRIVRAYIEATGMGASAMGPGFGDVTADGVVLARISYNGRIWNPEGEEVLL